MIGMTRLPELSAYSASKRTQSLPALLGLQMRKRIDRRQLFLPVGDFYFCRFGPGGWNASATARLSGLGWRGEVAGSRGFFRALLHVADVVEDQELESVELSECARERLAGEQLLDELLGGHEEHGVTGSDESVAECAGCTCFSGAGQAEGEDVGSAIEKGTGSELAELADERRRQTGGIESFEGLSSRAGGGLRDRGHPRAT
jgi:hypothetical protein